MQCGNCALARIVNGRIFCGSNVVKDWTPADAEKRTCPGYVPGPPTYVFVKKPERRDV